MSAAKRQMHLGVFVLGTGNHSAGWRYEGAATSHMELPVMQEIARIAERGKFDLLFISDSMVMEPERPSVVPVPLRADDADHRAAATCTTHVGLGATVSTSFYRAVQRRPHLRLDRPHQRRPRRLERRHHLQPEGGAEFQPATSTSSTSCATSAPTNSSMSSRACGIAGRTARSSPTRRPASYIDAEKVRPLNHKGRFFKVRGPINMARCPQGHPVIIQAGGSPSGLELAARTADVVFSVVQELDAGQEGLCRSEGPHGEIRPRTGRARGVARA